MIRFNGNFYGEGQTAAAITKEFEEWLENLRPQGYDISSFNINFNGTKEKEKEAERVRKGNQNPTETGESPV